MEEHKKEAAQEVPVQEQSLDVKIKIGNIDELETLISEINTKIHQLKNFKLKVETLS